MADKWRRKKEPRHIRLYHSVTGCEAWQHLSPSGVKVLIALARFDDGNSNGELYFSERTAAAETKLARNTVRRALAELIDKGFIAQTKPGAFNRNNLLAATYRLTWVAWPGGKPSAPTRDFENWKPGNSQAQNLTETGSIIDQPMETETGGGSIIEPLKPEKPLVSVVCPVSEIEPQVLYQGEGAAEPETQARKQAIAASGPILAALRTSLIERLQRSEAGEQSRLADQLGIPAGTLSKFINGRNLPDRYRAALAEAIKWSVAA
jgi:DNA-binding MarR family transcriptional regulator